MRPTIWKTILWLVVLAAAAPLQATNYTITGSVRTPTGAGAGNDNNVKYIKVIARDQGVLFDTDEGSAYTAANGTFSMTFNFTILLLNANINLYMNILYEGTALDGRFIKVRNEGSSATLLDSNVEGLVRNNLPGGTYNLGILRTTSTAANMRFRSRKIGWADCSRDGNRCSVRPSIAMLAS